MTWTLFWQFVFLIAWTVFCVRVTWRPPAARRCGHTDTVGVRWIGDRR